MNFSGQLEREQAQNQDATTPLERRPIFQSVLRICLMNCVFLGKLKLFIIKWGHLQVVTILLTMSTEHKVS